MSIGPESSDSFEFVVDTYQPRDLRISLCCTRFDGMSEKVLCCLDIPVISLIDALISNGYEYDNGYRYTMWFPMTTEEQGASSSRRVGRHLSDRREQRNPFPAECGFDSIKLDIKWKAARRESDSLLRMTRMYSSIFVDSVAVSIISNGRNSISSSQTKVAFVFLVAFLHFSSPLINLRTLRSNA